MTSMSMGKRLALGTCLLACSLRLAAITISVANPYSITVGTAQLSPVDTAGGRIPDPYPASPDDDVSGVLLTIGDALGNWRVDVQQSDVLWDPDVVIQLQRRTGGTGPGTAPAGGTTYFALDGTVQAFFTGNLNRSNIRIRFRLQMNEPATRISPVDARSYSAGIIFTVTDT